MTHNNEVSTPLHNNMDCHKESSNFANELQYNSIVKADLIARNEELKKKTFQEKKEKIKHEKFVYLTDKYFSNIIGGIMHESNKGLRIKYMNFDKNEFKANFPELGFPREFMRAWFDELSKPDSIYLPNKTVKDYFGGISEKKISLEGIHISIWNNRANTVVFTW